MRFGIVLAGTGPLAAPAAVETTARAAQELRYASIWSSSPAVLRAAARVGAVPLGLLLVHPVPGQPVDGLTYLAGPAIDRRAGEGCTPTPLLLESGPVPPTGAVDGWCPRDRGSRALAIWSGLLLVRLQGVPERADLERLAAVGAAEVLVHLQATSLDGQLAGFAAAAEAVAALSVTTQTGPGAAALLRP